MSADKEIPPSFKSLSLEHVETVVPGSTRLYDGDSLCLVPIPSSHPEDPLNLPPAKRWLAIASVLFFGSIAIAMQQIMASFLPVFMFEYAGLDPKLLNKPGGLAGALQSLGSGPSGSGPGAIASSSNPMEALAHLPGAPPLSRVNLLSSLPILMVGLSNYFLVPLAVTFGRRPVMVCCGAIAWASCIWAGQSHSLESHLGARCIQAIGAGAVESLIPLIVQDMSFIHQRGRAIGMVWASQGLVTISLGIGANYIVARMSWRWLYYIGGIITAVSWVLLILFLPETRWQRSVSDLRGERGDLPRHVKRPDIDYASFGHPGPLSHVLQGTRGGVLLSDGIMSVKEIFKTMALPAVLYCVVLNAVMLGIGLGSSLTATTVLLASPYNWAFDSLGYMVIAPFVSSIFVALVGGVLSDKVANHLTKKRGGAREAEVHLWNMFLPLLCGVFGCVLYGIGGTLVHDVHWMCLLSGICFLTFSFLTSNAQASVFCVESYPHFAGPVLVNVSSFRNIIGFAFTYGIPDWVASLGYLRCFGIFAGIIGALMLPFPLFLVYGKKWRKATEGIAGRDIHSL